MKSIFILTDIEGVAGVVSFEEQSYPTGRYHDQAKRLLTAEVNAAVNVLVERGVEDILICDGHGPGGIWFEDLHPAARLLHGRPITVPKLLHSLENYDAAAIIGQHAMAGAATGNQNHTQSSASVDRYTLNGKPIGEIAQFALYAGSHGVPVIFLSGEADACREIEALIPHVTTASVKQGLGRGSAISLSAPAARQRVAQGMAAALDNHAARPVAPLVWDPPFVLEKRYFHTHAADSAACQPGVEQVDSQTIRIRGEAIREVIYR